MSEEEFVKIAREIIETEEKRSLAILKEIVEKHGWIMKEKDLKELLDIIEEYNEKVEETA
jgi:NADH:ubiquinone oxidoreductase subunit E